MKFSYEYRTSDNVRHDGVISASSREDVYAQLRAKGIRPGSVSEAPGFFNKLFGKGKRWMAIGILVVMTAALLVVANGYKEDAKVSQDLFDSPTRRQIIGDRAIVERGIKTGWADFFELEGDRFLASFAIPGVPAGVRSTTVENLCAVLEMDAKCKDQSLEARQIYAIVAGMKKEILKLRNEGWTVKEVGAALVKRQDREIAYYEGAKASVTAAKNRGVSQGELDALLERKNLELRRMGIRPITFGD